MGRPREGTPQGGQRVQHGKLAESGGRVVTSATTSVPTSEADIASVLEQGQVPGR